MPVPAWRRTLIALVVAAATATGLSASTPSAAAAVVTDRIYFHQPGNSAGEPGKVRVMETRDGIRSVRDVPDGNLGSFTPDGTGVAFARPLVHGDRSYTAVAVSGPEGSGLRTLTTPDPATQSDGDPQWWLGGEVLYTRVTVGGPSWRHEIRAVKADGTGDRLLLDNAALRAADARHGSIVTGITGPTQLRRYDPANGFGAPIPLPDPAMLGNDPVRFSPDGTKLAFLANGDLYLGAADGTGFRTMFPGSCGGFGGFTWGPDSDRIGVQLGPETGITVFDLTGRMLADHATGMERVGDFRWQPTGSTAAPTPLPAAPATPPAPTAFVVETPQMITFGPEAERCRMVFARAASDKSLWFRTHRGMRGVWTPWQKLGGPALDLAVHPDIGGGYLVLARGPENGSVFMTGSGRVPGQWAPWQRMGGPAADVHVLMYTPLKQPTNLLVLARDPHTGVVNAKNIRSGPQQAPDAGWFFFGPASAEVTVTTDPVGGRVVLARARSDGAVYAQWQSSAFPWQLTGWQRLGGPAARAGTAAILARTSFGTGAAYVVTAQDPVDGSLWTNVPTSPDGYGPWRKIGDPALDFTTGSGADGAFVVVARNRADRSYWVTPYNHTRDGAWEPQPWFRLGIDGATLPALLPPDQGNLAATVAADGTMKVWECPRWECLPSPNFAT